MAKPTRSAVSGAFGVAAGLGAALPSFTCTGACASCFACAGLAGAMGILLAARLVLRRRPSAAIDRPSPRDNPPTSG